jgi:hypothetical protein
VSLPRSGRANAVSSPLNRLIRRLRIFGYVAARNCKTRGECLTRTFIIFLITDYWVVIIMLFATLSSVGLHVFGFVFRKICVDL